ncbi:hypothetical protein MKC97_04705 [[Clostridium] innocuum]|nr:hypothetical protein [[Clostridium] innocuum]
MDEGLKREAMQGKDNRLRPTVIRRYLPDAWTSPFVYLKEREAKMKEKIFYRIIMAAAFVLTVCSLLTHNDWILLLTAIFMACCVIITFIKK